MMAKLELKKLNERERWKMEKERRKAMETPEEKRARNILEIMNTDHTSNASFI